MHVAIVGYRDWHDYELFEQIVKDWESEHGHISVIISGGATGVDTMAERYAHEHNRPTNIFNADWFMHGKGAGPIRNQKIVDASDAVIAFLGEKSKGTKNCIKLSRKKPIPTFVYKIEELKKI